MGAALAMAEGTAGVRSAGGADKATVAASEALRAWAYGKVHYECNSVTFLALYDYLLLLLFPSLSPDPHYPTITGLPLPPFSVT